MDLDFSNKVTLIRFLQKLININEGVIPLGALHRDLRSHATYIYIGERRWMRVQ